MLNITRANQNPMTEPTRTREWDPFRVMQEMMRWDPFQEMAPMERGRAFYPQFDVKETGDAYVFTADLPGVKENDVEISLTGNRLVVSGKRDMEDRKEGDNWYTYERSYGSFTRAFTLPQGVDADKIDAQLKDGVLTLTVAKKPEVQPRRIQIGKTNGKSKVH